MSEIPVTQIVDLRQEKATIERKPVDREATEADFTTLGLPDSDSETRKKPNGI